MQVKPGAVLGPDVAGVVIVMKSAADVSGAVCATTTAMVMDAMNASMM